MGQITWTEDNNGGTGKYSGIGVDGQDVSATYTIVGTSEDAFTFTVSDLKIGDNVAPEMKLEFTRTEPAKSPSFIKETDEVSDYYDRLKGHDAFAGKWAGSGSTSDGQEFETEQTSRWVLNRNFLLTDSVTKAGGQVIFEARALRAWDPSAQEVKQWSFNSWAGMSESVLAKRGEGSWVEQAKGIGMPGTEYSAKIALTFTGENAMKVVMTDQKVGDETPGDIQIELERKTPSKQ